MTFIRKQAIGSTLLAMSWAVFAITPGAAEPSNAFTALTSYVAQQVQSDKVIFIGAQRCTEWFYKQLKQKPPRSLSQPISLTDAQAARPFDPDTDFDTTKECRARFPSGLESARQAFGRAQSALSISLTFYELVLVGDRDDDHRYNETELRDLLESFKLPFPELSPTSEHVATLTAQFELARQGNTLEAVMASMGLLYEKGYRLTTNDRTALNTLSG